MTPPVITKQLHDVLELNPGKAQVHFTGDGHYHFRVFSCDDKANKNLYTRLKEVPEKSKQGVSTGKFVKVPIKDIKGNDDERHLVAKTLSREQVLAMTPVDNGTLTAAGPSKAEILASLGVTDEELDAFLKAKRKK